MKKDKILISALIGGFSTIAGEIITKILVLLGIGQYGVFELNSLLLTNNQPSILMGFIVNFIIGSFVGVIFYLIFKKLGCQHLILKCSLGSLILWFIFELGFTSLIEDKYITIRPLIDHYVHILGTFAYGATLGVFLKVCLFKKKDEKDSDS